MKKHFADQLVAAIQKKNSVICVGIDPRLDRLPKFILDKIVDVHGPNFTAAAHAFLEFGKGIIDAVADLVPVVKPQIAFYEQYGFQGFWAYEETCRYARSKGLLVIGDAKRGDIGTTAEAYAGAFLGTVPLFDGEATAPIEVDALTVNPYLGYDGILPFVKACEKEGKGIFVLVKTSNPSSGDLQDRITVDEQIPVSHLMAHFVESWGSNEIGQSGYSAVGAVVGATYPGEAAKLRALMPENFFLVPGFGAQGGTAEDVAPCFNEDGLGAVVNSSREILFAFEKMEGPADGSHYQEAARSAAIKMNEALNKVR